MTLSECKDFLWFCARSQSPSIEPYHCAQILEVIKQLEAGKPTRVALANPPQMVKPPVPGDGPSSTRDDIKWWLGE